MKRFLFIAVLCALVGLGACAPVTYEKQAANLGFLESADGDLVLALNTEVDLTTVRSDTREQLFNEAQEQVLAIHKLVDGYHRYADESGEDLHNVYYLNQHFGEGPLEVDPALIACLDEALTMAELTKGYFNPTVGLLVDAYEGRFEHAGEVQDNPTSSAIDAARASIVPYEHLRECIVLDTQANTVELRPYKGQTFGLNVGAIGKGFALEQLAFSTDTSYMLSAGSSSIRTHVVQREGDTSWSVAAHEPDSTDMLFAFQLDDASLSASGDDESYYLLADGTRVSHILNPFTGYSENYWRNVIVVGDKAGVLDALSTALFNVEDEDQILDTIHAVEEHYGMTIDYCFVQNEEGGTYMLSGNEGFLNRMLPEYMSDKLNPRMYIFGEGGE